MSKDTEFLSKQVDKLEKTVEKVDEKCDNIDKSMAQMLTRFESHLAQDEKMYEEFKRMVTILQSNTNDMRHHIQRTDILQELYVKIENRLSPIEQERMKKEAVREWMMAKAKKWGKVLGIIGTVAGIAYSILEVIKSLN